MYIKEKAKKLLGVDETPVIHPFNKIDEFIEE